jgi:F-type H+-transporting ATPase subunit delta
VLKGAVARRYADAVFEIGAQQETVDRWRADLGVIAEYFGNRRLAFVLNEPKIPFTRKEQIVRDLLASKVQPEALNVALLLVERGLVDAAPAISTQFEKLYNDYRGQAVAQITTAIPLDAELRTRITAELSDITGKRILLQEKVDPSILGGAIARIGDTLIDGSLKRRFQLLRQQIAQGGTFGGPLDGADGNSMAPLPGPNGAGGTGGTGGTGGADSPNGARGDGSTPTASGPESATDTAPRPGDGPHMAPRRPGTSTPDAGKSGDSGDHRSRRPNTNNKRRRR